MFWIRNPLKQTKFANLKLTKEQRKFIKFALAGNNVLVDACIGSGKTTSIQCLCDLIPKEKQILYLTYNRLLKLDAQEKITNPNVHVQNYHGYALERLKEKGVQVARADLIHAFNRKKLSLPPIDVLIIDEYQDIDTQIASMLQYIKSCYPTIQIIMVGDMQQKIYNYTSLDVEKFVSDFIKVHETVHFTTCFRLSKEWANNLGTTWKKEIHGANNICKVQYMDEEEAITFLSEQDPRDILCLGPQSGPNNYGDALNKLEELRPDKFNKRTVYASIRERDADIRPNKDCAIFTTYDSSKGLERRIVVLFGWTFNYWQSRSRVPYQEYHILRNIFCVAASRGKERIIIVKQDDQLTWETIQKGFTQNTKSIYPYCISQVFEFGKTEYARRCFSYIKRRALNTKRSRYPIEISRQDGMIDLSPCIGIYQEAMYFNSYDIDEQIRKTCEHLRQTPKVTKADSLFRKILYLTSLETNQMRYQTQVNESFITEGQWKQIENRLKERLSREEHVQEPCQIICHDGEGQFLYEAVGFADVIKKNTVYELKFTSELSEAHFLQCAAYMIALKLPKGILWNIYSNEIYEITVTDKKGFLDAFTQLLTSGAKSCYEGLLWTEDEESKRKAEQKLQQQEYDAWNTKYQNQAPISKQKAMQERLAGIKESLHKTRNNIIPKNTFAVLDTETTWNMPGNLKFGTKYKDTVFSVGVVIADAKTFEMCHVAYYILTPECTENGMYAGELKLAPEKITKKCTREECINELNALFGKYHVKDIFAYNAGFDFRYMPELSAYTWRDIMKKAAYQDSNPWLKSYSYEHFYSTGRLKSGYGVEDMCQLLKGDEFFYETHCAIFDSIDELFIIKQLSYPIEEYPTIKEKPIPRPRPSSKDQYMNQIKKMRCGMNATIIGYRSLRDIDVEFEDHTVCEHVSVERWINGTIENQALIAGIVGQSRKMKDGLITTVIECRKCDNLVIEWHDHTTLSRVELKEWEAGTIRKPIKREKVNYGRKYIGQTRVMNCGKKATVIAYQNSNNITVQFEDGWIKEHCRIDKWRQGKIAHPKS